MGMTTSKPVVEARKNAINELINILRTSCAFSQDDFRWVTSLNPLASKLKPIEALERIREALPNADVIRIVRPTTTHHRVFKRQFWVIYMDDPRCYESVARKILTYLDDEVLTMPEKQAHALLTYALKQNYVKEEIIKEAHKQLDKLLKKKTH